MATPADAGPSGPGKTSPRLLNDLLTYDPRFEEVAGWNLLTTSPPHFDPSSQPLAVVPVRNCRHVFMIKHEQTKAPSVEGPSAFEMYKLATYCQNCRWHVDLYVDFRGSLSSKKVPCRQGSGNYPLHHFLFVADESDQEHAFHKNVRRSFRFRCSAAQCPVELTIRMRPPRFTDETISLLTNQALLRRRLAAAREIEADRAGDQMARPIDGLDFLATYLMDSMNPKKGKGRIPLLNRKFLKTFGRDCNDILNQLGFTHKNETKEDGTEEEVWYLPTPSPAGDPLDPETDRTMIEDAYHELVALILDRPEPERASTRNSATPQPAIRMIETTLGCQEYEKRPGSRTRSAVSEEDHPYYAGLGAMGDFSDALLLFAFNAQMSVDLANSTYYFECLQHIARGRDSEMLQTQAQLLASEGYTNRQEVANAYHYIGMDPAHGRALGEDMIIAQFRSRLQDLGSAAVEETRNALRVIGHARNSELIKQEASNAIETYAQAMSWLGLDEGQPDEFVVTMYGVKVGDNPADIPNARKAVYIIAENRKSQQLRDWLTSGHLDSNAEMDIGDAYRLLGIQDRSASLDLEALAAQKNVFCTDTPENSEKYDKAYALICKDQQTNHNNSQNAHNEYHTSRKSYPLANWPVGCKNNGNTCYLNSVLQFLFTVKPLRDQVLDYEGHLQEISPDALKTKKVGRIEVTAERVETAQKFVRELKGLFENMITANSDCIRPEMKLAALALSKPVTESNVVAPGLVQDGSGERVLGHIEGLPVAGPMLNPETSTAATTDSVMGDDSTVENTPSSTSITTDQDEDHKMDLDEPLNGVRAENSENPVNGLQSETVDKAETVDNPEPPSRPPPIPPRPIDIKDIEGLALQQDAAEILNNVFDLLSCAFKGDGLMDDSGEQYDFIKRLFFSNVTTVTNSKGSITRNSAIQDQHLLIPGRRNRPIYAALDDVFSVSAVDSNPEASRFDYIETPSPFQIFNLKRLVFENGQAIKDDSQLFLDEVLYLDRYLGKTKSLSEQALQDLREQKWELQRKLDSLDMRKKGLHDTELKISVPDAMDEAADLIDEIIKTDSEKLIDIETDSVPADLPPALHDRAIQLRKEMEILDNDMKELDEQIASIFQDCKDEPYRLHAVFMHRGGAKSGHYWIYIYDSQNKVWRNYNDEYVSDVEVRKVFEQEGTATSTGVVYVKDELIGELTEAVRREPKSDENVEMQDVEMQVIDGVPLE